MSVVSLLLTSPTAIVYLLIDATSTRLMSREVDLLVKSGFRLLTLINNSINFFIYVLMSGSFRAKFIRCVKREKDPGTSGDCGMKSSQSTDLNRSATSFIKKSTNEVRVQKASGN